MIVVLAGGVGGSRLARGLAAILSPDEVIFVVNTADDFEHLGLRISPDLDTVMYALAGRANPGTGWGIEGETWGFMGALARIGGETWFRLGDQDLATHVVRTQRLQDGESLSQVTQHLCRRYGVEHAIVPMTDSAVHTVVKTAADGELAFQDYFVRRRCEPAVVGFEYRGARAARPSPRFEAALCSEALEAIVFAPSNPFLSIAPILAVTGVRDRLASLAVPKIAVSPLVGGRAVKGPADKIMRELGHEPSARAIAALYGTAINAMIVDARDATEGEAHAPPSGVALHAADTLMNSFADQQRLARAVVELIHGPSARDS